MAEVTLRQAAGMVGVNRQTIYRMVKEGRLSATLRPDPTRPGPDGVRGSGHIKVVDTAELHRVFGRLTPDTTETPPATPPASNATPPSGPAKTPPATPPATGQAGLQAMTAEDRRREYEIADREALRSELAASRDALKRAEDQLAEAKEREAKLLDLLAGHTRLLEHREAVANPPRPGFWRRVFGG